MLVINLPRQKAHKISKESAYKEKSRCMHCHWVGASLRVGVAGSLPKNMQFHAAGRWQRARERG